MKNVYTKIYLKYIYFLLSIVQIHLHIHVLNKICTFGILNWYTCGLKQLILYLTHINCAEVQLKIYLKVYLIVLKRNYSKYTSGSL